MGKGHWGGGGGGQHYKPSVVWGGGGLLRNKNLAGGGVAEEMTGLPKNCPAPPQLINNDRPLSAATEVSLFAII